MKLEDLSPDMQEKAESCETNEELMKLAEAEGVELSEEDLDAVAGGISKKKVVRLYRKPLKKTRPQPVPQPNYSPDAPPTVDPFPTPKPNNLTLRNDAYEDLLAAVTAIGYPRDLATVLADELRGEKSMCRMAAYLRAARPKTMDEIADEMLAIIEQRNTWVKKKITEHAQSSFNEFLNREVED